MCLFLTSCRNEDERNNIIFYHMTYTSDSNKTVAKNSIYMSIRMVIVLCITLYTTRAILNVLGVEDYGIYNVVCGFVSMLAFLNTSMSNGIQRYFNFEYGKNGATGANRVYNTALIIQSILGIVILILAESFGLWYIYEKMVIPAERFYAAQWIFQLSLISFLFIIMQAPYTAAVMAHERMDFYAIVSVLDAVLKLGIVFFIPLFNGDGLIIYGVLQLLISALNFILYYVYSKKNFREIKLYLIFDKVLFRSMLGFSGWNVFGSFANMMKEQGINLIMNLFFGPIVNAARGIAVQINSGLQSFVANLGISIRPQIVQSYAKGDIERTMNLYFSISKLSCCLLYLISLPVVLEIDFILHIWLGENVPEHTTSFIFIIILTSFVNNLNAATSNVVHATGKMMLYQVTGGLTILLAIPLAYFVLKFGATPEWALIMSLITMSFAQVIALVVLKKIVNFSINGYLKKVIIPFFCVVTISSPILYFIRTIMEDGILRFCLMISLSIFIIGIVIYHIGLNIKEKSLIKNLFLDRIHHGKL